MTMTPAIILNVLSLGVVSAWFTLALQLLLSTLVLRHIATCSIRWQKPLLFTWALLPVLVGIFCSVTFFVNAFTDIMWAPLAQFIHWHHLFHFEWLSWHGGLLISWYLASVIIVCRHLWLLKRHGQSLQSVTVMTDATPTQLLDYSVVCLRTSAPIAFTAGMLKPMTYVSEGLIDSLSSEELGCVLAHEHAHQKVRDPLQKWVFSLVSAYYPSYYRRRFREAFELASELRADQQAANETGTLNVASTLVAVRKSGQQWQAPLSMAFGQDFVERRVEHLLQPFESSIKVPAIVTVLALVVFTTNVLSMDSLHHYVELILSF